MCVCEKLRGPNWASPSVFIHEPPARHDHPVVSVESIRPLRFLCVPLTCSGGRPLSLGSHTLPHISSSAILGAEKAHGD